MTNLVQLVVSFPPEFELILEVRTFFLLLMSNLILSPVLFFSPPVLVLWSPGPQNCLHLKRLLNVCTPEMKKLLRMFQLKRNLENFARINLGGRAGFVVAQVVEQQMPF